MRTKYLAAIFVLALHSLGQSQGAGPTQSGNASVQPPVVSIGLASPEYQEDFPPIVADDHHAVSWNKGYLLSFGNGSRPIALYDKTGKWLFETPVTQFCARFGRNLQVPHFPAFFVGLTHNFWNTKLPLKM